MYGRVQEASIAPCHQSTIGIPLPFEGLWVVCDAAFLNSSSAAVGVIVYGSDWAIHDGIEKQDVVMSTMIAEALVVRKACFLLNSSRFQAAWNFSDYKEVMDICCSWKDPTWDIRFSLASYGF